MTKFAIIPAPGYSGNEARVVSVHRSLAAAQKKRGNTKGWAIIETHDGDYKGRVTYMDAFAGHRFCPDGVLRRD